MILKKELASLGFNDWIDSKILSPLLISHQISNNNDVFYPLIFKWLKEEKEIITYITPIDSWDSWSYNILAKDCMSPFFQVSKPDEYPTVSEAEFNCIVECINFLKSNQNEQIN